MIFQKVMVPIAMAITLSGCSGTFEHLLTNAEQTLPKMPPATPGEGTARARAMYCLDRARADARTANYESGFDIMMIALGSGATGVGTTLGAAGAAVKDEDSKESLGIASTTFVAAGAAVLLLRTALNLSDAARTQRIAAARRVDAASRLIELSRSSDRESIEEQRSEFSKCVTEDMNVANSSPGTTGNGNGTTPGSPQSKGVEAAKVEADKAAQQQVGAAKNLLAATRNLKQAQANRDAAQAKLTKLEAELKGVEEQAKNAPPAERPRLQAEASSRREAIQAERQAVAAAERRLEAARKEEQSAQEKLDQATTVSDGAQRKVQEEQRRKKIQQPPQQEAPED